MSQVHQIAPQPHQVEPIDLPDDGAQLIETTGVEIIERWPMPTPANVDAAATTSNDNAVWAPEIVEKAAEVVPFVTTLPRVR
jgi:hypothetical protein